MAELQRRYEDWVRGSYAAVAFDPNGPNGSMVTTIQGLARLDLNLIRREAAYGAMDQQAIETALELTDKGTLSYLWVLGAYEVIRTMAQHARETRGAVPAAMQALKNRFERIRIPLAKMEPARKSADTDFAIAYPVLGLADGSAGWLVAANEPIFRRELADGFLQLLLELRAQQPHFPENQPAASN